VIDVRGGALALCGSIVLLALAAPAEAATGGAQPNSMIPSGLPTGGAVVETAAQTTAPKPHRAHAARTAVAPAGVPAEVAQAIDAANAIVGSPYVWGGGHRSFASRGYDCSGAVSYLLHGGGLLDAPLDSSSFMHWGAKGRGRWITVYTNPGHAFVEVAGLRLDTSSAEDPTGRQGPQWRPARHSHAGFHARHPIGF
jgi:hypothetical protein